MRAPPNTSVGRWIAALPRDSWITLAWILLLNGGAAFFYLRQPNTPADWRGSYGIDWLDPAIALVREIRARVKSMPAPAATACALPFIAMALRAAALWWARVSHRMRGSTVARATSLPLFDWRLFLVLLCALGPLGVALGLIIGAPWSPAWPTLDALRLSFHVTGPVVFLVVLGLGLAVVCAFTLWPGGTRSIYPFSGFPIFIAITAFLSYALLCWSLFAWLEPQVAEYLRADATATRLRPVTRVRDYLGELCLGLTTALALCAWASNQRRHGGRVLAQALSFGLIFFILALPHSWSFFGQQTDDLTDCVAYPLAVAGLAWTLTIIPFLTFAPALILALERSGLGANAGSDGLDTRVHAFALSWVIDLVRGHLVLLTVMRRNATTFALSMTLSTVLPLAAAHWWMSSKPIVWVPPFALVSVWFGATAAWLAPFLHGLIFVEETFSAAYAIGIHRSLQTLRGHLLVLGFGDLGRRMVEAQFRQRDIAYDHALDHVEASRNVLLPNGRLAKVLQRIAVVDRADTRFTMPAKTPDSAPIATFDVTAIVAPPDGLRGGTHVTYVLPAVVGDVSSGDVRQLAGFDRAAFVCCLVPPDEERGATPARVVFEQLVELKRGRTPIPAAIALHAARDVSFISHRALVKGLPVHCLMPEHIEGLNAAQVLHAADARVQEDLSEQACMCSEKQPPRVPRVLICGRGKRIYYLLDSFLKGVSPSALGPLRKAQASTSPALVLASPDATFKELAREDPATKQMRIAFTRMLARNPAWPPDQAATRVFDGDSSLDVAFRELPMNYEPIRDLLRATMPDIILISDQTAADELKILHSVIVNLGRLRDERGATYRLPILLVSGETGQHHLKRNLADALVYYWSLMEQDPAPRFPSPHMRHEQGRFEGDWLIDVLEDPVERIQALTRMYGLHQETIGRPTEWPVQLDMCTPDELGELAYKFARLAGYDVKPAIGSGLSIRDFRVRHRPASDRASQSFEIRTFAALKQPAPPPPSRESLAWGRVRVTCGDSDHRPPVAPLNAVLDLLRQGAGTSVRDPTEPPMKRKTKKEERESEKDEWKQHLDRNREQITQCCGMPTCPVESIHKIIEASLRTCDDSVVPPGQGRFELQAALVNAFDTLALPGGRWNQPVGRADEPLASISIECVAKGTAGALALALNALLFQTIEIRPGNPLPFVFNFWNVSGYGCHDSRWGVMTCYGRMQPNRKRGSAPTVHDVLTRVVVHPVVRVDDWKVYSEQLAEHLSGVDWRREGCGEPPCKTQWSVAPTSVMLPALPFVIKKKLIIYCAKHGSSRFRA